MTDSVDVAGISEASSWQHVATRLRHGRRLGSRPLLTSDPYADTDATRDPSIDVSRQPQNSSRESITCTTARARSLNSCSSSSETQACGDACLVRKLKPCRLGGAIVEFASSSMREKVMRLAQCFPQVNGEPRMEIGGVPVILRRHVDKFRTTQRQEVPTSIFVSWSHSVEKQSPLPLGDIVDSFDVLVARIEAPQPVALPAPRFML
eukprot:TRINITY_DN18945_c0_g1_i1.p1 TRINITY_DN18945_c0_g1~~TRINITY_DN18945_c0_g1_i1.p1  ORF type:complete len:207 (+),score=6.66 TRINITY_DN18945_c0_g1_i1:68-688(+)